MAMDAELKAKWLTALRSGKYQQGRRMLIGPKGHCCLGVFGEVADLKMVDCEGQDGFEYHNFVTTPAEEKEFSGAIYPKLCTLGIPMKEQRLLADMNDDGKSFAEIADYIDANL